MDSIAEWLLLLLESPTRIGGGGVRAEEIEGAPRVSHLEQETGKTSPNRFKLIREPDCDDIRSTSVEVSWHDEDADVQGGGECWLPKKCTMPME